MQPAWVVKLVDTRDLKSLGSESGHAGSSPAPGTVSHLSKGIDMRWIGVALVVAPLLSGCIPIGVRGSTMPFACHSEDWRQGGQVSRIPYGSASDRRRSTTL